MALKNYQYNAILRSYDALRQRQRRELEERRAAAYASVPALKQLDEQTVEASIQSAKRSLLGDASALKDLAAENRSRSLQKTALLKAAGFPEDFLELRYTCLDCKDTGYIGTEKCHCFKQAVTDLLYSGSGLKEILEKENFSFFSFRYFDDTAPDPELGVTSLENMHTVLKKVRRFLDEFDTSFQNLFLYGNTGVGKTFLSNCIAKDLLDRAHHVIYLTAYELFALFEKYGFRSDASDVAEDAEQFAYLFDCDLLIIDDLGTELSNAFTNAKLYSCINERYLKRKSTIISTNLSLRQFADVYSERIFSRITSYYVLLKLIGNDIRLKRQLDNLSL